MKKAIVIALMLVFAVACESGAAAPTEAPATPTATQTPTPTPITLTLSCADEQFIQAVIDLSEQDADANILKIYAGMTMIERSDNILKCRGEARMNTGPDIYLAYYYEIDREGDAFIGYEAEDYVPTPTPTPTPPTATPEPTPIATPTPTPAPIPIGTTLEISGSRYTVNEVLDPAQDSEYFDAEPGNRLVAVDITQEGIEDGDPYNPFYFFIQDEDGYVYMPGFIGADVDPRLGSGELLTGQKVRGWVSFEVPEKATLVAVLVEGEVFGPKTMIADLTMSP